MSISLKEIGCDSHFYPDTIFLAQTTNNGEFWRFFNYELLNDFVYLSVALTVSKIPTVSITNGKQVVMQRTEGDEPWDIRVTIGVPTFIRAEWNLKMIDYTLEKVSSQILPVFGPRPPVSGCKIKCIYSIAYYYKVHAIIIILLVFEISIK